MKKVSIYKVISIIAFIALFFILSLPNFFNIDKKQESEVCIKNMRVVYNAGLDYLQKEQRNFSGSSSDLERMGYLSKAYECPSEAPGDKYQVNIDFEAGTVKVRCINEINSSPFLTVNSFENFVYFVNILKYHQKPTSEFIYNNLNAETKELLQSHVAYSDSYFNARSWMDWDKFLDNVRKRLGDDVIKEIWAEIPAETQQVMLKSNRIENPLSIEQREEITAAFNNILANHQFSKLVIGSVSLSKEARGFYKRGYADLNQIEKQRLNRIVVELIFPYEFQMGMEYNIPSDVLAGYLVENINDLLKAGMFNDPLFIDEVHLSSETVNKMESMPEIEFDVALTNRLILHDAYPTLLVKYADAYSDHRLPPM